MSVINVPSLTIPCHNVLQQFPISKNRKLGQTSLVIEDVHNKEYALKYLALLILSVFVMFVSCFTTNSKKKITGIEPIEHLSVVV